MKGQDNEESKILTLIELSLSALLNEQDLEKLEAAIYALEPYKNVREVIDALKSLLEGRALRTELVAIEVLGRTQSEDLTSILITKLNNKNKWIKAAAIEALSELGNRDPEVIDALEKQFADNSKNRDFVIRKTLVALKKLGVTLEQITNDLFNQLKSGLPINSWSQPSKDYNIAYDALSNLVPVLKPQNLLEVVEFLTIQDIEHHIRSNIAKFLKDIQELQLMNLIYLLCKETIIKNSSSMSLIVDIFSLAKDRASDKNILEILKLFIPITNNQEIEIDSIRFHDAGILAKLEKKLNDPLKFIVKEYLGMQPAAHGIQAPLYGIRDKKNEILHSLMKRVVENYLDELIDILIDNNIVELIDYIEENLVGRIPDQNIPLIIDMLLAKIKNSKNHTIKNLAIKSLYKLAERIPENRFLEALKHFLGSPDKNIDSKIIAAYIPEDKVSEALDNLSAIIRGPGYNSNRDFAIKLLFDLINKISDERFEQLAEELSSCYIDNNLYKTVNNLSLDRFNVLLDALLVRITDIKVSNENEYVVRHLENLLDYYFPIERIIPILTLLFHRVSNREKDWIWDTDKSYKEHKQIDDATKKVVDKIIKHNSNTIKSDLFEFFIDIVINTDGKIQDFAFDTVKKMIEINQPDIFITTSVIEKMLLLFSSEKNYKKEQLLEILLQIPNLLERATEEQITQFIEKIMPKIQCNNCYNKNMFVEAIGNFSRYIPTNILNSIKELLLNLVTNLQNSGTVISALEAIIKIDLVEHGGEAILNNALSIVFSKMLDKNTEVKNIAVEVLIILNNENPEILVNECLRAVLKKSVIKQAKYQKIIIYNTDKKNNIIINANAKIDMISKFTNIAEEHNIADVVKGALSQLSKEINSKKWDIRETAINIINDFVEYIPKPNIETVFDMLVAKFNDKNPQVRIASIDALSQLSSKNKEFIIQVLDMLINKISDKAKEVDQVVQKTIPSLVENVQESSVSVIFNLLISKINDKNPQVKIAAINTLTQFVLKNKEPTTPALDKLIKSFEYENVEVMKVFLEAISNFIENSQESSVNEIFRLLFPLTKHADYKVRNLSLDAIRKLGMSHQNFKFLTIINESKFASKVLSDLTIPLNEDYKINDEIVDLLTSASKTGSDEYSSVRALDILLDSIPEARMITVIDFLMFLNQEASYYSSTSSDARKLVLKLNSNQLAIRALSSHLNSGNALVKRYAEELSLFMFLDDNKNSRLCSDETAKSTISYPPIEADQDLYNPLGMSIVDVPSDGNCFFYAVERQLQLLNSGETIMSYRQIREFALSYIRNHRDEFKDFMVDETIEQYLDRMSQDGQWTDHNFIQALSRELQINIVIISSNHVDMPQVVGSTGFQQTIYLGHIIELHYVSLERINNDETDNENFAALEYQVHQELLKLHDDGHEYKAPLCIDASIYDSNYHKPFEKLATNLQLIGAEVSHNVVSSVYCTMENTYSTNDNSNSNQATLMIEDEPHIKPQSNAKTSINFNDLLYKSTVLFKSLDFIVDTFRFINEPSVENVQKALRDVVHLQSAFGANNMHSMALSFIDITNQLAKGEIQEAGVQTITTIGYMALPTMLAYTGIPYLGFAYGSLMAGYTGYHAVNNAYSLYSEYGAVEWQLKSAMAYKDLYEALSNSPFQYTYDFALRAKQYEIKANSIKLKMEKAQIKQQLEAKGEFGDKLYEYIHATILEEKYSLLNKIISGELTEEQATTLKVKHLSVTVGEQHYEGCVSVDSSKKNYNCYNMEPEILDQVVLGEEGIVIDKL